MKSFSKALFVKLFRWPRRTWSVGFFFTSGGVKGNFSISVPSSVFNHSSTSDICSILPCATADYGTGTSASTCSSSGVKGDCSISIAYSLSNHFIVLSIYFMLPCKTADCVTSTSCAATRSTPNTPFLPYFNATCSISPGATAECHWHFLFSSCVTITTCPATRSTSISPSLSCFNATCSISPAECATNSSFCSPCVIATTWAATRSHPALPLPVYLLPALSYSKLFLDRWMII